MGRLTDVITCREKSELMMTGERPKTHVNVSTQVVSMVVSKHTSMTTGSGQLPLMMEFDEDGIQ